MRMQSSTLAACIGRIAAVALAAAPGSGVAAGSVETRFVQAHRYERLSGLGGAISVELSPDERHVYVTGFTDHSLAVFQRDPVSGALTWLQTLVDGDPTPLGPIDGLTNAARVIVSPDGAHVYSAGWGDSAIGYFVRAPDGRLGYRGRTPIDPRLAGVGGLDFSGDGSRLFAAAYNADRVTAWTRDPATGLLAFAHEYAHPSLDQPRAIFAAPNGAGAFVVAKGGDALFVLDYGAGGFTLDQVVTELELDGAYDLAVAAEGSRVYVASFDGGRVSYYRDDGGGLQFHSEFAHVALVGPAGLALAPDGRRLYVSSSGSGLVFALELDPVTGAPGESTNRGALASGPVGLALSSDARHLYAAALGGGVAQLHGEPLDWLSLAREELPGSGEPLSLAASADGRDLYLAIRAGSSAELLRLRRDAMASGASWPLDGPFGGAPGEARVWLPADGGHLYVARSPAQTIEVWDREPIFGGLTLDSTVPASGATADLRAMAFAPLGEQVYTGGDGGLLAHWQRAPDGGLGFVAGHATGRPIRDLAVSPDGAYLYAGFGPGPGEPLLAFARDPVDGALTAIGALPLPARIEALDVSSDSSWVYAATDADSLVVLRREASGVLTPTQTVQGGLGGDVPALEEPVDLAVAPYGDRLYALARATDAVVVFARDPATGALAWLENRLDSEAGLYGLAAGVGLEILDAGAAVAVLAAGSPVPDGAVTTFRSDRLLFADGFDAGLLRWSEVVRPPAPRPAGTPSLIASLTSSMPDLRSQP